MPYCADTDFLIDLKDQDEKAIGKLEQLASKGEVVSTTVISVAEFYFGAYKAQDRTAALSQADALLEPFAILHLDYEAARKFGKLGAELKSNMIESQDLFIASIALVNKQTLITRNVRHFERVPDLKVESW
jgi:tRNA(fMet)-specific endonuclease VapC